MLNFRNLTIILIIIISAIIFSLIYFNFLPPKIFLNQTSFAQLTNWEKDDHAQAFVAFQNSCGEILKRNPDLSFSALSHAGFVRDWQTICLEANKLKNPDQLTAKLFFETWFKPYVVKNNLSSQGLFTGYYLPLLQGSLKKNKQYSIPIYARPSDLIKINLGKFRQDLSGKTITGQLKNNEIFPYPNRSKINAGAIQRKTKVLLWCDNLVDLFFAQIQGSALVQLPDGKKILIGYDGENGQPYTAIGRVLLENKALDKKNISMQSIKDWLKEHPSLVQSILERDASYVFFRILKGADPLGSEQITLTATRSLAVDTHYIPLGSPVWLDTEIPKETVTAPYQRLMIAQDTGGSIKGIIRGDVYCGAGDEASYIAGHMKSKGQYFILLPRKTLK